MPESLPFEATVIDGDILAIVLGENLDTATTPAFEQEVQRHLEAGYSKIILDCRHLGYVSSIGIGALITLQSRLRRKGGAVKLAAILGPVMQLLRLVRLDKVFDIYGDLEFARQSFYDQPAPEAVADEHAPMHVPFNNF